MCHRIRHQAAHATVAVIKRVDEVEPMMRRGHGKRSRDLTMQPIQSEPGMEMRHERGHGLKRRRNMGTDLYVALPPFSWNDPHHLARMAQSQHFISSALIEGFVKPFDEQRIGRVRERTLDRSAVDLFLQADMGGMFLLERPTSWISVKVAGKSPFDVAGTGIVPLDAVGVVTVHHPHHCGQIRQGAGWQVPAQAVGRLDQSVRRLDKIQRDTVFQPGRFDTGRGDDMSQMNSMLPLEDCDNLLLYNKKSYNLESLRHYGLPLMAATQMKPDPGPKKAVVAGFKGHSGHLPDVVQDARPEQATYATQDTPDIVEQHYDQFLPQDKSEIAICGVTKKAAAIASLP